MSLEKDTLSFGSRDKYYKKYATLPDEIKKILKPQDAVDMFRDMEWLAQGKVQRWKIGEGDSSKVYANPWLEGYYCFISYGTKDNSKVTIYSGEKIGDAIWQDKDNGNIQILKRSA